MGLSAILLLFQLLQLLARIGAGPEPCFSPECDKFNGPIIWFPFWQKDHHHPDHCTYPPGFGLSCFQNDTILELSPSLKLVVERIDYKSQLIHTRYRHDCPPPQHLNRSLYTSPFQLPAKQDSDDYSFFNCSSSSTDSPPGLDSELVLCLGDTRYSVYAIKSQSYMSYNPLLSCKKMYDISSIPYGLLDQQLILEWSNPPCGVCEKKSKKCGFETNSRQHEIQCFDPNQPTTNVLRGVFLFILVIIGVYCILGLIKRRKEDQLKIEKFLEDYVAQKPARYSYADMKTITNNFRDKIGKGGYGEVYKGKLSSDVHVAVKILNNIKGSGDDFINEFGTIGRIHHVNVVRLVGYCADGFRRALVYEFLPNHSLERYISSNQEKKRLLSWEKLQEIALGIGKGIEYLHHGCDQLILHFDIKPSNILLDHNFNPKISDFGLAKLCSKELSAISMTLARGTVGYIAPEVYSRNFGKVSSKSDVYSFGMLLLEMARVRDNPVTENMSEVYFPEWIYNRLDHEEEVGIQTEEDKDASIVKKLIIVGLWCTQWSPMDRPSMKVALNMLEGDGSTLTAPPNPLASTNSTSARGKMVARPSSELEVISELE